MYIDEPKICLLSSRIIVALIAAVVVSRIPLSLSPGETVSRQHCVFPKKLS